MLVKKIIKLTALSVCVFTLVACSNNNPAAVSDGSAAGYGDGNGGAHASGLGEGTSFEGSGRNPMAVGDQVYYFDFDRSDVHESDMASLKVQADYLASHPRAKVLLAGNTDERGSREYNIALGDRRARSVEAILEADGVSKNQITVVSYGAEKPVALGHDEESYNKNRRVELDYQTAINK